MAARPTDDAGAAGAADAVPVAAGYTHNAAAEIADSHLAGSPGLYPEHRRKRYCRCTLVAGPCRCNRLAGWPHNRGYLLPKRDTSHPAQPAHQRDQGHWSGRPWQVAVGSKVPPALSLDRVLPTVPFSGKSANRLPRTPRGLPRSQA